MPSNDPRGRHTYRKREREREREREIKGGQLFIADEAEALEKCKGVEFSLTLRWATTLWIRCQRPDKGGLLAATAIRQTPTGRKGQREEGNATRCPPPWTRRHPEHFLKLVRSRARLSPLSLSFLPADPVRSISPYPCFLTLSLFLFLSLSILPRNTRLSRFHFPALVYSVSFSKTWIFPKRTNVRTFEIFIPI